MKELYEKRKRRAVMGDTGTSFHAYTKHAPILYNAAMSVEKWVGIVGSSQQIPRPEVVDGVKDAVAKAYSEGKGIVVGGSAGIDAVALGEMMQKDPSGEHVKILVPTTYGSYLRHCRRLAINHIISVEESILLTQMLEKIRQINPQAIVEDKKSPAVSWKSHKEGNGRIVESSQEVEIFWTENSRVFIELMKVVWEAHDTKALDAIGIRDYRIPLEKPATKS